MRGEMVYMDTTLKAHATFSGGVHPAGNKELTSHKPGVHAAIPKRVVIPLSAFWIPSSSKVRMRFSRATRRMVWVDSFITRDGAQVMGQIDPGLDDLSAPRRTAPRSQKNRL